MISPDSRTRKWIDQCRKNLDPELAEKMILAFMLTESLKTSGLDFIFKGGTSLSLITGNLSRFSIDVDIIVSTGSDLTPYFKHIIDQGVFTRYEEDVRASDIPVKHFKFFFVSSSGNEKHILIDVLFEDDPYPHTVEKPIISPLLQVTGDPTTVTCPTLECLQGDKLTAFAPHTTGVQFNKDKELEIIKQLFDVATLFDYVILADGALSSVFEAHANVAVKELEYRKLGTLTPIDVLQDTFQTSCMIGTYGKLGVMKEYEEILSGSSKLQAYVYSGPFNFQKTILCAAKVACLAAAGIKRIPAIQRFDSNIDPYARLIQNRSYNRLNKVGRVGPEPYFYFCQALEILGVFD
jgi:hypothetical protein